MIELLLPQIFSRRTDIIRVLEAVHAGAIAAGRKSRIVQQLTPQARVAVIWGAGHPEMQAVMRKSVSIGVPVIAWDLGYWERTTHYRCAVNDTHPNAAAMSVDRPTGRFDSLGIALRNDWDPAGPIVLVGMGVKCARMYGEPVGQWERTVAAEIKARFSKHELHFRARPQGNGHCADVDGFVTRVDRPIIDVLRGASLVVCRHSNVAIDAIVAGIPVVAMAGAASAVCPNRLEDAGGPLPDDMRRQFLSTLAWLNWSMAEMREASTWEIIEQMTEVG